MIQIIRKPLVTEKNTVLNAMGVYVFEVDKTATKIEIKKAVETAFRVKVDAVNTSICRGHTKRNKYGFSKVKHWKKAMVKLAAGEKIALFEGAN